MKTSLRANQIKPSPTLEISAKAAELREKGKNIINLSAGEPDFDTPVAIKKAAILAIQQGFTKYTPVDGLPELKTAIIDKFKKDNQLSYTKEQILVSSGAKQSVFNLCQALLNPGDEAIIPCPYWVSYPDIVLLAEAKPVFIQTNINNRFKITAQQLKDAITPKTKLLFLNTPNNPSGIAYSKDELAELGKVLLQYPDITIISDDIYEKIIWADMPFSNIVMACPQLDSQTVVINGVSKAYAMTGWRIGYAAGPNNLIKAMKKIQSQSTSNPCSISQKAAINALNGSDNEIKTMVKEFKLRHDYMVSELNKLPGIECLPSDGAFYLFINVQEIIKKNHYKDDIALAQAWLESINLALVPGTVFGVPGYVRLSYATSMINLKKAIERLNQLLIN